MENTMTTQPLSEKIITGIVDDKVSQKPVELVLLKQDVKQAIQKTLKELKDNLNHYPKDIFMEVSKEELNKINVLLMKELKFPIDRLSAHMGRIVESNCKETIDTTFKKYLGGLAE